MISSKQHTLLSHILRRCYYTSKQIPLELSKRTLKRIDRRVNDFENNIKLAEQFNTHRQNVIDILQNEENINALFENESNKESKDVRKEDSKVPLRTVSNYEELQGVLGKLSYNDIEMRNTILLVCHSLVESLYIEAKLRKLDDDRINPLLNKIKLSFDFESFQDYRFRFVHFKSSQFLNFPESDYIKEVNGNNFVQFGLTNKDSTEYIDLFTGAFTRYEETNDHFELGIEIIQILLHESQNIPTVKIWKYLFDKLDQYNLYNFQQIIYRSLFQYKHQPTVLATPNDPEQSRPQLMADHFVHLIESYPDILASLCKYQEVKRDKETFIQLLSFLRLDKLAGEVMVLKSPFLSIAKFKLPENCPGIDLDNKELTISRNCLYLIMRSCINLQLFEYVDLLYDKIVLDSIDPNNIQLNYILQKLVEGEIFTPELFLIILEACKKSDNLGRVLWLLPFLDEFIAKHDNNISKDLKDSIIEVLNIYNLEGKLLAYKKTFT